MDRKRKTLMRGALLVAVLAALLAGLAHFTNRIHAEAKGDLDEILDYEITVDVNEDATLTMFYHIEWKVLDSKSEGPLEWVKIGIPNKHYVSYKAVSDTIDSIKYMYDNGTYLRIDLDRDYKEGEVVIFEFELHQDYMYEMNVPEEGKSQYAFTPGWFPDCIAAMF